VKCIIKFKGRDYETAAEAAKAIAASLPLYKATNKQQVPVIVNGVDSQSISSDFSLERDPEVLNKAKYLVIDTETTGLKDKAVNLTPGQTLANDEILQLAWLLLDENGQVIERKSFLVNDYKFEAGQEIPNSDTHYITSEHLSKATNSTSEVFQKFIQPLIAKGVTVVGHNINYDIRMITAAMTDPNTMEEVNLFGENIFDTLNETSRGTLSSLTLSTGNYHNAAVDVESTSHLFISKNPELLKNRTDIYIENDKVGSVQQTKFFDFQNDAIPAEKVDNQSANIEAIENIKAEIEKLGKEKQKDSTDEDFLRYPGKENTTYDEDSYRQMRIDDINAKYDTQIAQKQAELKALEQSNEVVDKQSTATEVVKKVNVEELFNSNPELANQVYEALGFQVSENNAKSKLEKQLKNNPFKNYDITFDFTISNKKQLDSNFNEIGVLKDVHTLEFKIENKGNLVGFASFWKDTDGIWYANNINILNKDDRKKGIMSYVYNNMSDAGFQLKPSKEQTDDGKAFWAKLKINTNQITPQQKQQALQLYSQYLDTGKQDIEGFNEFVKSKQAVGKTNNIEVTPTHTTIRTTLTDVDAILANNNVDTTKPVYIINPDINPSGMVAITPMMLKTVENQLQRSNTNLSGDDNVVKKALDKFNNTMEVIAGDVFKDIADPVLAVETVANEALNILENTSVDTSALKLMKDSVKSILVEKYSSVAKPEHFEGLDENDIKDIFDEIQRNEFSFDTLYSLNGFPEEGNLDKLIDYNTDPNEASCKY